MVFPSIIIADELKNYVRELQLLSAEDENPVKQSDNDHQAV
jgi:hypothetical protein